jgi:hypothetical protein
MRLVDWHAFAAPAAVIASEVVPVTAPVMTRLSLPANSLKPEFDAALLQPPAAEQPAIAEQAIIEKPQELRAEPREIPPSETLLALPRIAARDTEHVRMTSAPAALEAVLSAQTPNRLDHIHLDTPVLSTARPQTLTLRAAACAPGHALDNSQAIDVQTSAQLALSLAQGNRRRDGAVLAAAGLQTLVLRAAASASAHAPDNSQAIDPRTEPGSFVMDLATPSSQPGPRLAQGSRYAVRRQQPAATLAGQVEPNFEPNLEPDLRTALLPMDSAARVATPNAAQALPLAFEATPRVPAAAQIAASAEFSAPQLQGMKPMQPALRVDPVQGSPEPPPKRSWLSSWMQSSSDDPQGKHIWAHSVDFWQHAPRDLKLLAVAIPVLLALALHPSLPKVRVTAPTASIGRPSSRGAARVDVRSRITGTST